MIEKYSCVGKKIIIENNNGRVHEIEFETTIHTCLHCKDSLIVYVGNNATYLSRNIFRVSEDGKIVWQIQHPHEYQKIDSNRSAAFTYLGLKDSKIVGYSLDCFTYEIDYETGKLLNPVFTK